MSHKLGSKPNSATSHPVTLGKLLHVSEAQFSYLQNRDNKAYVWGSWVGKSSQHDTWRVLGGWCMNASSPFSPCLGGHSHSSWCCFLPSEAAASQATLLMLQRLR